MNKHLSEAYKDTNNSLAYRIVDYLMDMADYFEADDEEKEDAVDYAQECLDSGEVGVFVDEIQERVETAKEELQKDEITREHKLFYRELLADGEKLLMEIANYSKHSISEGIKGKFAEDRDRYVLAKKLAKFSYCVMMICHTHT